MAVGVAHHRGVEMVGIVCQSGIGCLTTRLAQNSWQATHAQRKHRLIAKAQSLYRAANSNLVAAHQRELALLGSQK